MVRFTQPTQTGIHFNRTETNLILAISLRNPTNEPLRLRTMTGQLFSPSLEKKNGDSLWRPQTASTQAVAHWGLEPQGTITQRYTIPNRQDAKEEADQLNEELSYDFSIDPDEFTSVDPNIKDILIIRTGIPSKNGYFERVSRQYDLRTNPERAFDDELPPHTMDAISRIS